MEQEGGGPGPCAHLLSGDLLVPVEVHSRKEAIRAVSQPHEHVAVGHALLQLHQLQLEEEHCATGNFSS